jgi:hypothetical protein
MDKGLRDRFVEELRKKELEHFEDRKFTPEAIDLILDGQATASVLNTITDPFVYIYIFKETIHETKLNTDAIIDHINRIDTDITNMISYFTGSKEDLTHKDCKFLFRSSELNEDFIEDICNTNLFEPTDCFDIIKAIYTLKEENDKLKALHNLSGGYVNPSRAREFFLEFTSSIADTSNPDTSNPASSDAKTNVESLSKK